MTHLRFALAQIDTCVGDLDGNADKIMHYAHLAAHEGAHVVIFPEMTLTGYPIEDLALRRTFRKAAWDKANWLATELEADGLGDLYVAVGTVGTDHASDKPRNRMVVLHDGMVWAGYDKHFLPNYGVFDEFRIFAAGDRTVVLDIDGVRIGVAICEDIWQDGGPVARLADEHIDVLMTMNGSPYEEGKTHTRYDLAVRRAAEVGAPMIYVNQVGGQDDLVFDGGSFVVDRDGTLLERSPMFMEHLGLFDLDTDAEHQTTGDIADLPDPDEEAEQRRKLLRPECSRFLPVHPCPHRCLQEPLLCHNRGRYRFRCPLLKEPDCHDRSYGILDKFLKRLFFHSS